MYVTQTHRHTGTQVIKEQRALSASARGSSVSCCCSVVVLVLVLVIVIVIVIVIVLVVVVVVVLLLLLLLIDSFLPGGVCRVSARLETRRGEEGHFQLESSHRKSSGWKSSEMSHRGNTCARCMTGCFSYCLLAIEKPKQNNDTPCHPALSTKYCIVGPFNLGNSMLLRDWNDF